MKRLYLHAAGLFHPNTVMEIGNGADPRVVRALRETAAELRRKAEYAPGGFGPTVSRADLEEALTDIVKTARRHTWRELFGEEYKEGDRKRAHAD
jgi:hypothetical protein